MTKILASDSLSSGIIDIINCIFNKTGENAINYCYYYYCKENNETALYLIVKCDKYLCK